MVKKVSEEKEMVRVPVFLRDEKYPYFESKDLIITNIGDRVRGRMIYLSGRFIKSENDEKFIEFERINNIAIKLQNAKIMKTEKGTLVVKFEQNSTLYVVEVPSGYRGSVRTEIINGECIETVILQSPRGSLGEVAHIWCNSNAEIQYKITGRTATAGYGRLINYFGESLSGKISIEDGKVKVTFDEELDKLLS
jgi:hypothetical protein